MSNCAGCFSPITSDEVECDKCGKKLHSECAVKKDGTLCDTCYADKGKSEPVNLPDVIRRSYIEEYRACPYKFYNNVILGIESSTGSHAQVGIDFHDFAEKASKGEIRSSKEFIDLFKPIFEGYPDSLFEKDLILYKDLSATGLREKLWENVINSADTLFSVLNTLPTTPYKLEETLQFSVGEDLPKVQITMDRIDLVDGQLEVGDWKTGAVMVGKNLSSDLQAPLYIKAIRDTFGYPVRKFTFYYLADNKTRVFERIDDENYTCTVGKREYKINLTDAIREVKRVFAQMLKGNFNIPRDTRNMYFTCKTCDYKKTGVCQGAELESWKQYNPGGW